MTTPYDVPASKLIKKVADYLKLNVDEVDSPSWANIVKTGMHVERPPQDPEWWYTRCASMLRKVFVHGPIGVAKLRMEYGGRKNYGVSPSHTAKASGAIIRTGLQQLEAAGFIETIENQGRIVSQNGRKILKEIAEEVGREVVKERPELEKYMEGI
ncbi:MAG: 30S ribosomal protein S19e [Thermoproteota archaeon]